MKEMKTLTLNGKTYDSFHDADARERLDELEQNGAVKTVNGIAPDENGNVNVEGGTGADGFSPVANVTQTASGAVISVTDKSGTTTATIANGKDGAKGDKGDKGDTGAPGADGAKGEKGDTGPQGEPGKDGANGKDGTSATHSWNGTVLTITSASGTSSADLKGATGNPGKDGSNGQPGADGVSPTVAVSKSGKVTTIKITDAAGTKTATINDGEDGANGSATIADGSITPEKTSFIIVEGTGEMESTMVPNFTNWANPKSSDWNTDTRFSSSSGSMSSMVGAIVTNAIQAKKGDIIRIKGIKGGTGSTANALFQLVAYSDVEGATKTTKGVFFEKTTASIDTGIADIVTVEDGVTTYQCFQFVYNGAVKENEYMSAGVSVRIGGVPVTTVDDIIITVNEPITYTEVTSGGKNYTLDEKIIVPRAEGLKSGAKWFALGDSITEGWTSAVDTSASSGYKQFLNTNEAERWVNIVAEKNGYILTNYGVGGTGYAHHTSGNVNARAQVANIDFSQCDMVTLAFGVNDWKGKATLGSMDDDVDTVDAFVPNMRYVIKKILADNPYCKIFVITPINCRSLGDYARNWGIGYDNAEHASGPGLEQIYQLEKTVCEFHGIELIDMTHCSIINRENIKTMLPDYVHPTVQCHAVMARELAKKITFQ